MEKRFHFKLIVYPLLAILITVLSSFEIFRINAKPTLFLIGDSTVKAGSGKGEGGLWGWGDFIAEYFNESKIVIKNFAHGGTSSRSFQTRAFWDSVLTKVRPGDYVILQFGHNDGGPLDDTARARGTIKGISDDSVAIFNPILKRDEVVYTYGWYLRKYVADIRLKNAIPIICSPIPRNPVKGNEIILADDKYALWSRQVAEETHADFVSLNEILKGKYKDSSSEQIQTYFTPTDHTHTNAAGARFNAESVVEGLKSLKTNNLSSFLK